MNSAKKLIIFILLPFMWGCDLCYDPVYFGDVPAAPDSAWNGPPIVVKETAKLPYDASNLSPTIPLAELLDMALSNNPSTRASWNAARASAYAFRASLSDYYPSLSFNGTLNAQHNRGTAVATSGQGIIAGPGTTSATPTDRSITTLSNNLTLTYLLLDFGGRRASAEFALQTLYASNWQHNLTMQQVMLALLNAYTTYLGNKGLVQAYEQDIKDAQVALDAAKVLHAAGLATLTDILLSQSNLEQFKTSLAQAQGAENTAFSEILIAVGLPPDLKISFEDLPQKLPVIEIAGNISELLETAKERRPDLGIAIAAIKQQEAQLAISYSSGMPTLTANANWNQTRFIAPKQPSSYVETAFLQLSFPIFQGFFFLNQQRQLRAQVEEALANLDVQLATVYTQVVTNYYSLKAAEAAMPSSQAAVEYSQRAYRGFIMQYKTGAASILDILTALTTLSNARAQQVLTRTQWAAALANLAFSVGVLDDSCAFWRDAPPKKLYEIPISDDNASEKK